MNKEAVQKLLKGITRDMPTQQQYDVLRLIEQEAHIRASHASQLLWEQTNE